MVHVLREDLVAKICRNWKGRQGIFLPFRSWQVFCVLFLHLQCIRPQLGLTRNHHLSVCFGRESFAHCGENSAQHLHKACLKSSFGFVLRSLIPGCRISARTLLCFFLFFVFFFTSAHAVISVVPRISTHTLMIFHNNHFRTTWDIHHSH